MDVEGLVEMGHISMKIFNAMMNLFSHYQNVVWECFKFFIFHIDSALF